MSVTQLFVGGRAANKLLVRLALSRRARKESYFYTHSTWCDGDSSMSVQFKTICDM
jgi:hypothetical protein